MTTAEDTEADVEREMGELTDALTAIDAEQTADPVDRAADGAECVPARASGRRSRDARREGDLPVHETADGALPGLGVRIGAHRPEVQRDEA